MLVRLYILTKHGSFNNTGSNVFYSLSVDLGFQVNNDVLYALVMRHMRKDGTLRFGDFVSAVLHLAVAFGISEFEFYFNSHLLCSF